MSKNLCFTVSYNRPYYIYNTINNILNQSFTDFDYIVKINLQQNEDQVFYDKLLQDFVSDNRLKLIYGNNKSQQNNYISTIKNGYNNHDILIKIDDDDIYHKHYLKTAINLFQKSNADIISFNSFVHINNSKIYGLMTDIGKWSGDINQSIKFGMPPTYIFNTKAYNLIKDLTESYVRSIHMFEDGAWRREWRKNNLKSIIFDDPIFTYNIHGSNISSKFLYDSDNNNNICYINNDYCAIYKFEHRQWKSYIYLNKRNNRVYHINHDDHGIFTLLNNDTIEIKWDKFGIEKFIKLPETNIYKQL